MVSITAKKHSLEFFKKRAHLRFRTNTSQRFLDCVTLNFAIHKFFNDKGFTIIHTPIITGATQKEWRNVSGYKLKFKKYPSI